MLFGVVSALVQLKGTDKQDQDACQISISAVFGGKPGDLQHHQRKQEKADHLQNPYTARY